MVMVVMIGLGGRPSMNQFSPCPFGSGLCVEFYVVRRVASESCAAFRSEQACPLRKFEAVSTHRRPQNTEQNKVGRRGVSAGPGAWPLTDSLTDACPCVPAGEAPSRLVRSITTPRLRMMGPPSPGTDHHALDNPPRGDPNRLDWAPTSAAEGVQPAAWHIWCWGGRARPDQILRLAFR